MIPYGYVITKREQGSLRRLQHTRAVWSLPSPGVQGHLEQQKCTQQAQRAQQGLIKEYVLNHVEHPLRFLNQYGLIMAYILNRIKHPFTIP